MGIRRTIFIELATPFTLSHNRFKHNCVVKKIRLANGENGKSVEVINPVQIGGEVIIEKQGCNILNHQSDEVYFRNNIEYNVKKNEVITGKFNTDGSKVFVIISTEDFDEE